MKAEVKSSGANYFPRYGRRTRINIDIEPENETERAVLRMAYSGRRTVYIWEDGKATIQIHMPRGKN